MLSRRHRLTQQTKKNLVNSENYILTLYLMPSQKRECEGNDNVIINNIKLVLEGMHNNKLSYNDINHNLSIKTEEESNLGLTQNDILWLFLIRYNILSINNVFLDSIEEDIKMNATLKVIENKIKYKHVIQHIKDYYNKRLSEYKDDKIYYW